VRLTELVFAIPILLLAVAQLKSSAELKLWNASFFTGWHNTG
jgi:hypothetical protein